MNIQNRWVCERFCRWLYIYYIYSPDLFSVNLSALFNMKIRTIFENKVQTFIRSYIFITIQVKHCICYQHCMLLFNVIVIDALVIWGCERISYHIERKCGRQKVDSSNLKSIFSVIFFFIFNFNLEFANMF